MKRKITLGIEAKEQLLEGARQLYLAVSTTLGPKGQNGVIQSFGEPVVTHDGVTVAKAIENLEDVSPGAQVGIEMIKSSSSKTNDNVGDGTTSSTILAYTLIDEGLKLIKAGANPMVLRRELKEASLTSLSHLDDLITPVATEQDVIDIATISSEDTEVGKSVGKMYHKLGKDAMVVVEMGTKTETEYEIVEGYTFDTGLLSPTMLQDSRTQTTTIVNPNILVAHQTIGLSDIGDLLQDLYDHGKDNLVIIANDVKSDVVDEAILQSGSFNLVAIKAPGFGDQRIELLKDIAAITGTEAVGNKLTKQPNQLTQAQLGTCKEIVTTPVETVITGAQKVDSYLLTLAAQIENTTGEFEIDKIEKRVAKLKGKVGQIRVGGNTEMEAEERKYLIDDAVSATEAALKDGIVPGGGTTYIELSKTLTTATRGAELLKKALEAPFTVLMRNAGYKPGVKLEELKELSYGTGFDVMGDGTPVDLKEQGIIDPATVIRQAITNAVSVAESVLTTGVLITIKKDKDAKEEE